MILFYTHPSIDICMKRRKTTIKSIHFSDVKDCVFCLQIDKESFVMFFFPDKSDDLLPVPSFLHCRKR